MATQRRLRCCSAKEQGWMLKIKHVIFLVFTLVDGAHTGFRYADEAYTIALGVLESTHGNSRDAVGQGSSAGPFRKCTIGFLTFDGMRLLTRPPWHSCPLCRQPFHTIRDQRLWTKRLSQIRAQVHPGMVHEIELLTETYALNCCSQTV